MKYILRISNLTVLLIGIMASVIGQNSFEQLSEQLDSILLAENIPGSQIVIVNKDSILWSKNYGYADLETKRIIDDNTQFRIASITKTFAATAAMQLHEKGVWSIHDHLKEINPQVNIVNHYKEPLRLIHLLEHTSGLDDLTLGEFGIYTA